MASYAVKVYDVTFDFADYIYEHTKVYASNRKQVRAIMKAQYGNDVRIHLIENEERIHLI